MKYVSILETTSSVVRVRYDLPAGFGVPVAGSNYIALDITGKFYPAQAGSVNSVTRKSISGTAIANAIQFVVTIAELTAAGYTASTVVDYINSIAPDCLFAAYAAYDTTIAQTGFEDFSGFSYLLVIIPLAVMALRLQDWQCYLPVRIRYGVKSL